MIRAAVPADVPALHALVESAYRGDAARGGWTHEADLLGGQRTDAAALAEMLADPAQAMLVAVEDGVPRRTPASNVADDDACGSGPRCSPEYLNDALTGCVALRWLGDGAAYIGMVTVAPSGQGQGLGRALLGAAEEAARARDCTRAEMTVIAQRSELIAWYERRGYSPTGERRPFPADDPRFGLPKRPDLAFVVLEKRLT